MNEPRLFDIRPDRVRPGRVPFEAALQGVPLVIDNGSYHCRVGWAAGSAPLPLLDYRAVLNRPKSKASAPCNLT